MKAAVCITYADATGTVQQWQKPVDAASTCDAICAALDRMEAEGIDVDSISGFGIIAKAMPAGGVFLPTPQRVQVMSA